mgnify:CR=1 FL=1
MYLVLLQVESGDGAVVVDCEADVMIVNPGADIVPELSSMAAHAWCGELDLGDDHEVVGDVAGG